MHTFAERFAEYCKKNLNLGERDDYNYKSLSVCIIDCVYSLRVRYNSVTQKVVDNYAAFYMNGDKNEPGDTVSMLLQHIDERGGAKIFADEVLKDNHKLGGKSAIPKEDVCYQLAQYLRYLHIDTLEDFQNFESPELLEIVIRAVRGMGDAGTNYLFMLAGDTARCKPDVHIHQFIKEACGCDIGNEECQLLFTDTVQLLKKEYTDLTVRSLDRVIWQKYQNGQ
ncbi:MAG: hypothetical protein ACI4F4_07975 [Lachnospiraceae bacterium]